MPAKCKCAMIRLRRRHGSALRLVACYLLVFTATACAGTISLGNLIWVANGVLLAYLLLAPRSRWPAYLFVAAVGHFTGAAVIHTQWLVNVINTPIDLFEVLLAAFLLRRRSAQLPRFTQRAYLLRFLTFAAIAAPLLAALLYAAAEALCFRTSFPTAFLVRAATDCLGTCVVTPACVAVFRARFSKFLRSRSDWAHFILVAAFSFALLCQAKVPLPFLLYPLLTLVLLRLGLGWAAMATLFAAAVGGWFTVHGQGPFAASNSLSALNPSVILQLFVASAMFMLYSISVVLENLRATERRLQETAALHKLVMENSRDVIIVADFDGKRSFVSTAGSDWGGWFKEELLRQRSMDLVHPEDRPGIAAIVQQLRAGRDGAIVECRIRRRDEEYRWVEASLRTIRDPVTNLPTGILNSVRDITERKLAEQQLAQAYDAVEAMAVTDALTGLANRRRFDEYLAVEWRRGLRDHKALSLLLIDVDFFKSYNDSYGHLRGDRCLRKVAEAAQSVAVRPGDLVCRLGGDEFAVILPNTPNPGAIQMAYDVCALMSHRRLPHTANPTGQVSLSIGCATLIPQSGQKTATLIDRADKALYQAKRSGRNRATAFQPKDPTNTSGTDISGKDCATEISIKTH